MKTKLLIFTSTLFYANAKTMPRNLNNQPHIIAGDTNHSVPEYYGDMPHAGAQGDSLAATTDILHEDLVMVSFAKVLSFAASLVSQTGI